MRSNKDLLIVQANPHLFVCFHGGAVSFWNGKYLIYIFNRISDPLRDHSDQTGLLTAFVMSCCFSHRTCTFGGDGSASTPSAASSSLGLKGQNKV